MNRLALVLLVVAACGTDNASAPADGPEAPGDGSSDSGVPGDGSGSGSGGVSGVPETCTTTRAADRPDDSTRDQIRVLYVLPSDGPDLARDTNGQLCNSVRAFATLFSAQADEFLRFDTSGGAIDIGFVRLAKTDAQMRGSDPNNQSIDTGIAFVRERIERELKTMGLIASNKLYAVYYEGSSLWACGAGAYPPLIVGRVGAMYLRATPPGVSIPCGDVRPWGQANLHPDYVDDAMLHELVHSLGFVAQGAPHQHSSGHVYDTGAADPASDLMYSPRPGMPDPAWHIDVPGGLVLDLNGDDYVTDLLKSSLLEPLPAGAQRPNGW